MTSEDIHKSLRAFFSKGNSAAYVREFRAGTGYAPGSERYLDAWIIDCYPSSGMVKTAVEIKVSRSDFCREMKKPMKRDSALRISNLFFFAAPAGMIKEADLPDECGLIEISEDGVARIAVDAPYRECPLATWPFVASLARRAAKLPDI